VVGRGGGDETGGGGDETCFGDTRGIPALAVLGATNSGASRAVRNIDLFIPHPSLFLPLYHLRHCTLVPVKQVN
jgi:hypothetical protein